MLSEPSPPTQTRARSPASEVGLGLVENLAWNLVGLPVAGLGGKSAFVGGAQDGAAHEKEGVHLLVIQGPVSTASSKPS